MNRKLCLLEGLSRNKIIQGRQIKAATKHLNQQGFDVITTAEIENTHLRYNQQVHLKLTMLDPCDAVALIPSTAKYSDACDIVKAVAKNTGKQIVEIPEPGPYPSNETIPYDKTKDIYDIIHGIVKQENHQCGNFTVIDTKGQTYYICRYTHGDIVEERLTHLAKSSQEIAESKASKLTMTVNPEDTRYVDYEITLKETR